VSDLRNYVTVLGTLRVECVCFDVYFLSHVFFLVLRILSVLVCVLVRKSVFEYFFGSLRLGFPDLRAPLQVERVAVENTLKWPRTGVMNSSVEPCRTLLESFCKMIHMNESCHTFERVMAHMWTSHVTHMNVASHTYISPMGRGYEIFLNEDMNFLTVKCRLRLLLLKKKS